MKISNIAKVVCAVACLSVSNVANAQVRELATGDWFTITESRQADVTLDGQTFEVYDIIASVTARSTGNIHTYDQIQFSQL